MKLVHSSMKYVPMLLLLAVLGIITTLVQADSQAVEVEFTTVWENPLSLTTSTETSLGASLPRVSAHANDTHVIVAFNNLMSNSPVNNNPYYRSSSNNGISWSGKQPIFNSAADSVQVDVAYAPGTPVKAHAVWVENENQVFYDDQDSWPTGGKRISAPVTASGPILVDSPRIFVSSSTVIDVVWSQQTTTNDALSIYHARSTNGGNTWTINLVRQASLDASFPTLSVQGNTIHVVWEEINGLTANPPKAINYSRGTNGGSSWSFPIKIAVPQAGSGDSFERPQLRMDNNVLKVAYTQKDATSFNEQFVNYVSCSSNCQSSSSSWTNIGTISGSVLGANNSTPAVVISGFDVIDGCSVVAYHGTVNGSEANNEVIFSTSNCGDISWTNRVDITSFNDRSLRPSLAANENNMFLVFERFKENISQIVMVRGELEPVDLSIYMPFMSK